MNSLEKKFKFGKIKFGGSRRIYEAEVTARLEDSDGQFPVFKASGSIWNSAGTDIIAGGQCLDDMVKDLKKNPVFKSIHRLWKVHHLNDMHSASPNQQKLIDEWKKAGNVYNYDQVCKMLKTKDMFFDKTYLVNGKPYKYGSAWLYREIPAHDLLEIKNLLSA